MGYTSEAARALLGFAEKATPFTTIVATTSPENTAARRTLQALGFTLATVTGDAEEWSLLRAGERPDPSLGGPADD